MEMKNSLGKRLKEERRRLKLTQQALSEITKVSKRSQVNYETNIRSPDARYLSIADDAGIDIMYVVTGHRIEEISSSNFNWEKFSQILQTIDSWLAKRQQSLPYDKKVELARILVINFQITDNINESSIDEILRLVA